MCFLATAKVKARFIWRVAFLPAGVRNFTCSIDPAFLQSRIGVLQAAQKSQASATCIRAAVCTYLPSLFNVFTLPCVIQQFSTIVLLRVQRGLYPKSYNRNILAYVNDRLVNHVEHSYVDAAQRL